jgi:chemotaxis protein CheD
MRPGAFIAPPTSSDDVVYTEAILWAGDLVVDTAPIRMTTVLGSCVSVCLYDPHRQFGGMNHYLVPRGGATPIHGEWSTTRLIERMRELGSTPSAVQGKIFGGGSPLQLVNETYAVGTENVAVARRVLASFGIPILAERVSHSQGLRLFFENWTGVVWVRPHAAKGNDA